jgi:hypothetical protein
VRPFVIIGEEGFLNEETALKERSNILYIARRDKNSKTTQAIENLKRNSEILNKLGKLLLRAALAIDEKGFNDVRKNIIKMCSYKDRPLNTFTNTVHGLNLFHMAFRRFGIEFPGIDKAIEAIDENIKENVLSGGAETKTQIEMMFELIDEAISNRFIDRYGIRVDEEKFEVYLHLPTIYPRLTKYVRDYNRDASLLSKTDFIKQLKKSKYLKSENPSSVRMGKESYATVRKCYVLDLMELDNLELENLRGMDELDDEEQKEIEGFFKK